MHAVIAYIYYQWTAHLLNLHRTYALELRRRNIWSSKVDKSTSRLVCTTPRPNSIVVFHCCSSMCCHCFDRFSKLVFRCAEGASDDKNLRPCLVCGKSHGPDESTEHLLDASHCIMNAVGRWLWISVTWCFVGKAAQVRGSSLQPLSSFFFHLKVSNSNVSHR